MKWLLLFIGMILSAYEVNIVKVNGDTVYFDKYVKRGVSGLVLCPYENQNIICACVISDGKKGYLRVYDSLKNNAFVLPYVLPKKNDKVLLAKDYNRILIIAPNQTEYIKVLQKYQNQTVIHPDNFAVFLDEYPTRSDFVNFAKKMNIGRYIFVLDKIYEVDAKSLYVLKSYGKNEYKYNAPFFTTYNLSNTLQNPIAYYKNLIRN